MSSIRYLFLSIVLLLLLTLTPVTGQETEMEPVLSINSTIDQDNLVRGYEKIPLSRNTSIIFSVIFTNINASHSSFVYDMMGDPLPDILDTNGTVFYNETSRRMQSEVSPGQTVNDTYVVNHGCSPDAQLIDYCNLAVIRDISLVGNETAAFSLNVFMLDEGKIYTRGATMISTVGLAPFKLSILTLIILRTGKKQK